MELRANIKTVLDTDLSSIFKPLQDEAKRARILIGAEFRGISVPVLSESQQIAARQREVFQAVHQLNLQTLKNKSTLDKAALSERAATERQTVSLAQKSATDQLRIEAGASRQKEALRARDAQTQTRLEAAATASKERHAQKLVQIEAQAQARVAASNAAADHRAALGSQGGGFSGRSVASDAMRTFSGSIRAGVGFAADMARGAGVNLDLGSMVGKHVSLQKSAVDLSNSGFMPGAEGEKGQRQSPTAIMDDVKKAARDAAVDVNKMAEGLQSFVGKTGELKLGRELLGDMGKLARATGSDVGDMMNAAGDVAAQLEKAGIKENQAEKVNVIMRSIAGQGKQGAVEIRDMASQMAKLAAMAPQFSGSFEESVQMMGALTQEARQSGGAASATQAATSLTSFVSTFSKGQRRNAFKAAGVEVEDKQTGKLRNAEDIILDSLKATKGDSVKMGKLFSDAGARRVTRGFETIYKGAGGGEAGLQAVKQEFAGLKRANMSEGEVNDSFAASMQTAEAKAQLFTNQMQDVVGALATRFIPEIEKAGPKLLAMAEGAESFVSKLAGLDIGTLVGLAMAASIGKAALGELLKVGVEKAMAGGLGGGGAMFGAVASLVITAAAVALYANKMNEEDKVRQKDADVDTQNLLTRVENDKALYNVAVQETAAKQDALQVAKDEDYFAQNNGSPSDKAAAAKKREEAEQAYAASLGHQNQLGENLRSSTWELGTRMDVATDVEGRKKAAGDGALGQLGFSLGTFANTFTGKSDGEVDRNDVATAEALAKNGDRAAQAMTEAVAALAGKTLKVEIANLPGEASGLPFSSRDPHQ